MIQSRAGSGVINQEYLFQGIKILDKLGLSVRMLFYFFVIFLL